MLKVHCTVLLMRTIRGYSVHVYTLSVLQYVSLIFLKKYFNPYGASYVQSLQDVTSMAYIFYYSREYYKKKYFLCRKTISSSYYLIHYIGTSGPKRKKINSRAILEISNTHVCIIWQTINTWIEKYINFTYLYFLPWLEPHG